MENGKQGAFSCASDSRYQPGLTKREYFAGLAMQGIVTTDKLNDWDVTDIAYVAVKISDALLDRLKSE
jgi:hypothetical protein